jgi:hypothetical protein
MSTDKYTIWVGNLNYDTRTRDLERLFDEAGRIRRVFHPSGKGYAFIEFERYGRGMKRLAPLLCFTTHPFKTVEWCS